MHVGPAHVGTVAIELYVTPRPELAELAAIAWGGLRQVLGAQAVPEMRRPWRPHIAIAYSRADTDTTDLAHDLVYTRAQSHDDRYTAAVGSYRDLFTHLYSRCRGASTSWWWPATTPGHPAAEPDLDIRHPRVVELGIDPPRPAYGEHARR